MAALGVRLCSISSRITRSYGSKAHCVRKSSTISNAEVRKKRNDLFNKEVQRQKGLVTRIEKIEVEFQDASFGCNLLMNKDVSTPYDCARHINEMMVNRSVLAMVNGQLWDMHRPLNNNCKLKFLHFLNSNPMHCNKAFWRSCSFMMGMILERAFKDENYITLHSWPKPDLYSGSFVYDLHINIDNWQPKPEELRVLTIMFWKLSKQDIKFERLEIDGTLALKMFEDNPFKLKQIPDILEMKTNYGEQKTLVVYRLEDHVDISNGPMISKTGQVGRSKLVSAHKMALNGQELLRFQGVAIPSQLRLNSYAMSVLCERARKLNETGLQIQNCEDKADVV